MTSRVWLPDHAVLRLTGADCLEWLHGQVTQDVRSMRPGEAKEACFVRPTGQIEAYAQVFAEPEGVLLVVDRPQVVLARVADFVILEDVSATVIGNGVWRALSGPGEIHKPDDPAVMSLPVVDRAAYELQTLETGMPLPGLDYGEKTLLPELGAAFVERTVSYNKGCYTGQEVLMRVHSRGHTNKTWVVFDLTGETTPGEAVVFENEVVGRVTRVAFGHSWLGAAMLLNRATAPGTRLSIGSATGTLR